MPIEHSPSKKSGNKRKPIFSCQACKEPDNEHMVQCDTCMKWYHFTCVNVTDEIEHVPWNCYRCEQLQDAHQSEASSFTQDPTGNNADEEQPVSLNPNSGGTVTPVAYSIALSGDTTIISSTSVGSTSYVTSFIGGPPMLSSTTGVMTSSTRQGESYINQMNRASLTTGNVVDKRLINRTPNTNPGKLGASEIQLVIDNKSHQLMDNESNHSRTSRSSNASVVRLELEKLEAENRIKEKELSWQREYNDRKFKLMSLGLETQSDRSSKSSKRKPVTPTAPSKHEKETFIDEWMENSQRRHINLQRHSNVVSFEPTPMKPIIKPKSMDDHHQSFPSSSCVTGSRYKLNATHIAARTAMPKDLPSFNGNPTEWALFISMFETTTIQCNYTNAENMIRLQRCLKGPALDAVKFKLNRPELVAEAIDTFRMMFGRPEHVINALLENIRSEQSPRVENLNSIIKYALSVRNLSATMEASKLNDHLRNPLLLQELVQKLPASTRLEWATFKRRYLETATVMNFSDWIYELAQAASEVTTTIVTTKSKKLEKGYVNVTQENKTSSSGKVTIKPLSTFTTMCLICKESIHKISECKQFQKMSRNQRWEEVKTKNLCRSCLDSSHHWSKCRTNRRCGVDGCPRRHHHLLHNQEGWNTGRNSTNPAEVSDATQSSNAPQSIISPSRQGTLNIHRNTSSNVLFRIVPVTLSGKDVQVDTYAFLDDGSSITLIEDDLADQLKLDGECESLCLKWTGKSTRMEEYSRRINVNIETPSLQRKLILHGVRTIRNLDLPKQTVDATILKTTFPHLRKIPIKSYKDGVPRILIGIDNWHVAVPLDTREGSPNEPIATKTRLGWVIGGPVHFIDYHHKQNYVNFHQCSCTSNDDIQLTQLVKHFYSIESCGVDRHLTILESRDDTRARELLLKTTRRIGSRFETGLLWRFDHVEFPDSYPMALRRLKCLEAKMEKDPDLKSNLQQQIADYLRKGYARKLDGDELRPGPRTWYLPLFAVQNPNKPHKIRMVWDAAAKTQNVSLNSMLLAGPDQLSSLLGILYRSRERPIAICVDLKEMFHQVVIKKEDQDSQRFLWRLSINQAPEIYVMQVMTFGSTCSPSSAQFVKNINANEHADKFPRALNAITKNHYVDDWFQSIDSESEAIEIANEVKFVHSLAGFEIRNWKSNSTKVLAALGESTTPAEKEITSVLHSEKVLGMYWNTNNDHFCFALNRRRIDSAVLEGRRPTKREVLRILMTVFDPLGIIAQFLVYVKILMQDIWRSRVNWDDEILDTEYEKWLIWINLLPEIEKIGVPRCYIQELSSKQIKSIQLHIFVDSSEKAYAAVAYFRFEIEGGVRCALIGAKTKVTPLQALSIPRLELQAALLGARLKNIIFKEHSYLIDKFYMWTDSATVIAWLHSDQRKYKQYVALRVAEILEFSECENWRWIPTKLNIADEATKWKGPSTIEITSRWFTGPEFLLSNESQWPTKASKSNEEPTEELRVGVVHIHEDVTINLEQLQSAESKLPNPVIVKFENLAQWRYLVRSQAYVQRARNIFCSKIGRVERKRGPLTFEELRSAEYEIYRFVQMQSFSKEISILKNNGTVGRNSNIFQLSPYLDDGLLRIRGRIDVMEGVLLDVKRPIILPREHYVTRLIVLHYHVKFLHLNNESVVNELRQIYYIPRLRVLLRKIIRHECQSCKIENARPQPPEMGQLPAARLGAHFKPFTFTGVDFFGPMEVLIGRRTEKRWGMIFTCMTIRAVHVELACSLNTDSCIMCLRNFISRRGQPMEIYSDNGTNFVGSNNELSKELQGMNYEGLSNSVTGMKWNFITPMAPHMGGAWERMVRSFKTNLFRALPSRKPTEELLRSILIEIESVINSRPLTYIPLDHENDEALTPNHFILGTSNGLPGPGKFDDHDLDLRKAWRISQAVTDRFWRRWIQEYLPTLTRRTKWFEPRPPIQVDDPVVIVDEKHRNSWTRGVILDTFKGAGEQVRTVVVKTAKGIYSRPVVKVAVLDVKCPTPEKSNVVCKSSSSS